MVMEGLPRLKPFVIFSLKSNPTCFSFKKEFVITPKLFFPFPKSNQHGNFVLWTLMVSLGVFSWDGIPPWCVVNFLSCHLVFLSSSFWETSPWSLHVSISMDPASIELCSWIWRLRREFFIILIWLLQGILNLHNQMLIFGGRNLILTLKVHFSPNCWIVQIWWI